MAEEEKKDAKTEGPKSSNKTLLPWIILAAIVPISAGAGFGLGRLLASGKANGPVDANQGARQDISSLLSKKAVAEKGWYYQCDPVIANLNEPGANRYIRIVLTLEMSGQLDQNKGKAYLDSKQPLIKNWLTIYFASLALADVQGQSNLSRIAMEIRDGLNQRLFGDSQPLITNVYYSEWAIQ